MSKPLKLFIEQVIQRELEEQAKTSFDAAARGLALKVSNTGSEKWAVLYNPSLYSEDDFIVGIINFEYDSECKAWSVLMAAAVPGFGPLMYDIAFSLVGPKGLISDRGSVKPAARKVWGHNLTTRKNDFIITPLPDSCRNADEPDPNSPLNFKYVLKTPIDIKGLQQTHEEFLSEFDTQEGRNLANDTIDVDSIAFFRKRYHG